MTAKIQQHQLPNGSEVFFSSKTTLDILWREVFEDNLYDKHGIVFRDGDCVFDVGANIGFFVLYLNQMLERGTVFAFEPIPRTFELLKRNTAQNNHLDLTVFDCGLSDYLGTAQFVHYPRMDVASTMHPGDSGEFRRNSRNFVLQEMKERGGILKLAVSCTPSFLWWPVTESIRRYHQKAEQVTCRIRTVSDVIDEYDVQRIDLLKVDVEGAEDQVLAGLRDEHWPLVHQAVVEVHQGEAGLARVKQSLEQRGFSTATERPFPNVKHLYVVYATRRTSDSRGAGEKRLQ